LGINGRAKGVLEGVRIRRSRLKGVVVSVVGLGVRLNDSIDGPLGNSGTVIVELGESGVNAIKKAATRVVNGSGIKNRILKGQYRVSCGCRSDGW
jgi:hypothetical protein